MGIGSKIKKGYFFLEDKYYALLDRINRAIPIYKIVDPIDRVLPSFVVFLLLIALLTALGIYFLLPGLFKPLPTGPYYATIKVLGEDTNAGLKDAEVILTFIDSNESVSKKTDSKGLAKFEIPAPEAKVALEIRAGGYNRYFKEITISADKTKSFKLKRTEVLLKPKVKIIVYDFKTKEKILDRTITIKFTCSNGGTIPSISGMQSDKTPFEADVPKDCGVFFGTVSAQDYKSLTQPLVTTYESKTVKFFLKKEGTEDRPAEKGALRVKVFDSEDNPVEGVRVKLADATSETHVSTKFTQESGSVLFELLEPGYYDMLCDAGDGRTKERKNIKVNAGETTEIEVSLPELEVPNKKLFFKVVNAQTGTKISNARAVIRMDGAWFKSLDTSADGTITLPIGSEDATKTFTAMVSAPGYIMKIVTLPVLSKNVAIPTLIELTPKIEEQNFSPIALFTANPYAGTAPLEVQFDASESFDPDGTIVSYEWSLGDGNTASTVQVTHTFEAEGQYEVTLTVTDDDGAQDQLTVLIQVVSEGDNIAPIALFTMEPYYGYAPLTVDFNAEESFDYDGTIESYEWDFGDGETATATIVSHTFNNPGEYSVKLTVTDNEGVPSSLTITLQVLEEIVTENLAPIADFIVENNNYYGAVPFTVSFDAAGSYDPDGEIEYYEWDSSDGWTEGGEQKSKVMHTFTGEGIYTVRLTVKDNEGETSFHSVQIQVVSAPDNWKPVAIISADPYYGQVPLEVGFSASESFDPDGSIVFYRWDFGDGSTEEGINRASVNHTFASGDEFTVTLTIEDDDGETAVDSVVIQAYTEPPENINPVAVFNASPYYGAKPLNVLFDAAESFDSDGVIVSYEWDFGDGSTASGVRVEHTFMSAEEFDVTLTVTDNKGATSSRTRTIQVIDPDIDLNPIAKITASTFFGQKPLEVEFSASDSFDPDGEIDSWEWDFNDGETGTGETVSHTFTGEGYYEVKLTVEDKHNNSSQTSVFIQVVDWPVPTYGNIIVRVLDQLNQPIEGALIHLYREDHSTPIDDPETPIYSGTDGTHLFEDLPASIHKYYAKAFYDPNLSGESKHKNVVPSTTIGLEVMLSPRMGNIEVYVHKGLDPVQGANVSFLNAVDGTLLDDCTTTANGKCTSQDIVADTRVLVKAEKAGYLTALSNEIEIIADNTHTVSLELFEPVTGLETTLEIICRDVECEHPATSITSDPENENVYYFKFNLLLGGSQSNDVKFATIVGGFSEEALPAENYKIKILEVMDNTANALFTATCFNPDNVFEAVPNCTGEGDAFKHSIAIWNELGNTTGISKTLIVKIAIEPGLANGTTTEMHFAAKATQFGEEYVTGVEIIPIVIGAPVCPSDEMVVWQQFIEIGDERIEIPTNPTTEDYVLVKKGGDYNVFFSLLNCTQEDLSGIEVSAWNENDPECISFPELGGEFGPYTVATLDSLTSGELSGEQRILIHAEKEAPQTKLKLKAELDGSIPENGVTSMYFSILSDKEMIIGGLPNFWEEDVPITLSGTVLDAETEESIAGAIVQILLNDSLLAEIETNEGGAFSFTQESGAMPAKDDVIRVVVNAPSYNEFVKEIPVIITPPPSIIACVRLEPLEPIVVEKGASGTFDVISENCPTQVHVSISSMVELTTATFTLDKTDSKSVSFIASGPSVFQGIYPISIKGTLEGSPTQRHIGTVEVIINDPSSCYSMENYVFDLLEGSVSASITNNCFFENRDPQNPFIEIDNAGVELEETAEKDIIPEQISFTWGINSVVRQDGGSDFSVTAIEKSVIVNPRESLVFELDSFNVSDYINGNDEKGITGVKESSAYAGSVLLEVRFEPYSSTEEVEVWVEGNKIKARYAGKLETTGIYPFNIINKYLVQTEYAFITIEDLVSGGGD